MGAAKGPVAGRNVALANMGEAEASRAEEEEEEDSSETEETPSSATADKL